MSLGLLWGVKGCSRVSCAIVGSLENHSVVHVSLGTFPSAPVTGKLSTVLLLVAPLLAAAAFPAPTWAKLLLPGALTAFHTLLACLNTTPVVSLGQPQPLGTSMPGPTRDGKKTLSKQTPKHKFHLSIYCLLRMYVRKEAPRLNHASSLGLHAFIHSDKQTTL